MGQGLQAPGSGWFCGLLLLVCGSWGVLFVVAIIMNTPNKALKTLAACTRYNNTDYLGFKGGKKIVLKKINRARRALDKALCKGGF